MLRYIVRRLLSSVVVIWVIMTLSFFLMRAAPGGPFDAERRLPPAVEANLWRTYGMAEFIEASRDGVVDEVLVHRDQEVERGTPLVRLAGGEVIEAPFGGTILAMTVRPGERIAKGQPIGARKTPLWKQYIVAMSHYARLDFGATLSSEGSRTVKEAIFQTFPVSAELGLWAILVALVLGVGTGLIAGLKANTWVDYTSMSLAMVGVSMSTIVLGPVLIIVFSVKLGWIDYGGWRSWEVKVLPVVTLGLIYAAYFARLTRGGMLEVIQQDYIRTARAKGLPERTVVMRHAFKGAILPTVTFLGPALAGIMTGSVVIERIFNIPGVSEYFVTGAINRDYPLVMGVVVLFSALLVVMNLLVDIAYTILDPRVSYTDK